MVSIKIPQPRWRSICKNSLKLQSEIFPRCFPLWQLQLMSATTTEVAPWSAVLLLISRKFKEYIIWRDLTERKKLGNELYSKKIHGCGTSKGRGCDSSCENCYIVVFCFEALKISYVCNICCVSTPSCIDYITGIEIHLCVAISRVKQKILHHKS